MKKIFINSDIILYNSLFYFIPFIVGWKGIKKSLFAASIVQQALFNLMSNKNYKFYLKFGVLAINILNYYKIYTHTYSHRKVYIRYN